MAGLTGLCGAEPLPQPLADRLLERGVTMWNQYGPTEATVNATQACLRSLGTPGTIGRPIANTSVYVLDPNMEPVPIGVAGELWIGGHGLARGYLGQPELTAERFLPSPFTNGERIYRTGDLARWRHDGQLDFLGRVDHQVKLRGYRIELGEIEHALMTHPGVARAVVARRGEGPEAALVAYFTSHQEPPAPADLRSHLAATLPEYMLPAAYVALEAFPLTPSDKIDRRALPAPDANARAGRDFAAPTSDLERALMPLWQRLLGIREIGIDDDFFAVGGHSLLAIQLVHAIEDELDRACTIAMLMRNRTIRTLARELEVGGADATEPTLIQLADGNGTPVFCICGVHAYQELAEELAPDHPVYGIFLPVEQQSLRSHRRAAGASDLSVEAIAGAYRAMVRERQPAGPYLLLGFCFGAVLAYEVAQQLINEGDSVQLLTMLDPALGQGIAEPRRRLASRVRAEVLSFCEYLPRTVQRRLLGEHWVDETARLDRLRSTIYGDALRRYELAPYTGDVLVIETEGAGTAEDQARDTALRRTITCPAIHRVAGGHVSHLRRPYVRAVADLIRTHVDGQPD
jgi:thioesterase domain-containing protein/acyl carrier protein